MGLPYICPYNVNSIMNPILVMCLGLGYFFNLYRGKPLVREGGVLIMSHPTPWEFHPVHHPSYIDFFEQVLSETTDPAEIEAELREVVRRGRVVPPPVPDELRLPRRPSVLHVVLGRHALQHLGRVIIVGGDTRAVRRLGFKPASHAAGRAGDGRGRRRPPPHDHAPAQPADPHGRRDGERASEADRSPAAAAAAPAAVPRRCRRRSASRAARSVPRAGVEPLRRGQGRRRLRHRVGPPYPARWRAVLLVEGSCGRPSTSLAHPDRRGPRPAGRPRGTGDVRRQPPQPRRHAAAADARSPSRGATSSFVGAAADYFFGNRVTAPLSALALGAIPIERTKVTRSSADQAAELLDDGWSMLIFPEGGRSPDGWGQAFRGGAAYLSHALPGAGRADPRRGHRPGAAQGHERAPPVADGRHLRPAADADGGRGLATAGGPHRGRRGRAGRRGLHRLVAGPQAGGGGRDALAAGTRTGAWRRTWALTAQRQRRTKTKRWPEL